MKKQSKLKAAEAANRLSYESASPNAVDIGEGKKGFFVVILTFENGDKGEYSTTRTAEQLMQKYPAGTELEYEITQNSNPQYLPIIKKPKPPFQGGGSPSRKAGNSGDAIKAQWAIRQAVTFHNENGYNYDPEHKEKTLKQQAMNEIYTTSEALLKIQQKLEDNIKANKYQS